MFIEFGRLNTVTVAILSKAIYSSIDLYQNPNGLFFKSKKADPKINMELQGTPNNKRS